jgi:hypothetical protein
LKAAIAISSLIVVVVVGLLVLQRRDQADHPTDATADAMLERVVLADDLPVLFVPDREDGARPPRSFAALLETCDRVGPVLTGGAQEERAEASTELAEALAGSLSAGTYPDGFIDERIDASGVFADPLRRQFRQLSIALETHTARLIGEGRAEEARVFAGCGFELGRRVFVQNVRLRGRQRGLGLMRAGLGQCLQATHAMRDAGTLTDAQAQAVADDVRRWEEAIAAVESAWNTKLQTISSAKPNVADLVRVAELDEDRSFRVFATHQLGFARYERGEPANQAMLADAISRARDSDDPLIRAAGEAAAAMTREQFHTRER